MSFPLCVLLSFNLLIFWIFPVYLVSCTLTLGFPHLHRLHLYPSNGNSLLLPSTHGHNWGLHLLETTSPGNLLLFLVWRKQFGFVHKLSRCCFYLSLLFPRWSTNDVYDVEAFQLQFPSSCVPVVHFGNWCQVRWRPSCRQDQCPDVVCFDCVYLWSCPEYAWKCSMRWDVLTHIRYEDIHNSWLYCFTNPLEIGTI